MKLVLGLVIAVALAACGSKAKKTTTPENKTGTTQTDPKTGGATGGATYGGGAMAPTKGGGGTADPCAGQ